MGQTKWMSYDTSVSGNKMEIFLSYSKFDNEFAQIVDKVFTAQGIRVVRDIRDLYIGQNIKDFMSRVRESDFIILIVSENYLKSKQCMYEVLEVLKEKDFISKLQPIIIDKNVFIEGYSAKYVKYWQKRVEDLMKKNTLIESKLIIPEINEEKLLNHILLTISEFIFILRNHFFHTLDITGRVYSNPLDRLIHESVLKWNKKQLNASVGKSYLIKPYHIEIGTIDLPIGGYLYTNSKSVCEYIDDKRKSHNDSGWLSIDVHFEEGFSIPYSVYRDFRENLYVGKDVKMNDVIGWLIDFYGVYEVKARFEGIVTEIFIQDGNLVGDDNPFFLNYIQFEK